MYSERQINLNSSTHVLHYVFNVLDSACTPFVYAKHEQSVSNLLRVLQVRFDYRTKGQTDVGSKVQMLHSY